MPNEAATEWISPFFRHHPGYGLSVVFVLNPNTAPALVSVDFYTAEGVHQSHTGKSVDPSHRAEFPPPHKINSIYWPEGGGKYFDVPEYYFFDGWLYINADSPIIPSGFTQGANINEELQPMSFYEAEGVKPTRYILVPEDRAPDDLVPPMIENLPEGPIPFEEPPRPGP